MPLTHSFRTVFLHKKEDGEPATGLSVLYPLSFILCLLPLKPQCSAELDVSCHLFVLGIALGQLRTQE